MADLFSFVLTQEQRESIRLKMDEKAKLEASIAESQRRLEAVTAWLAAIATITGTEPETTKPTNGAGDQEGTNMTEAIERIANASAAPVPKAELKRLLARQGFPADRLGNYFYTAVHRLKEKQRITVQADGGVWRAP